MYISKETIIKSYTVLTDLFTTRDQGLTSVVSAIRYILALDMFQKKNDRSLDCGVKTDKDEFTSFVGQIVKINDNEYTKNFYNSIDSNRDFGVSSNFFSAGAVAKSRAARAKEFQYPTKFPALFKIKDYKVIWDSALLPNLSSGYLKNTDLKVAMMIWLAKSVDISSDVYDSIKTNLEQSFTSELLNELIVSKQDFDTIFSSSYSTALVPDKPSIASSDIPYLSKTASIKGTTSLEVAIQKILFGTPGAGKSHRVKEIINAAIEAECKVQVIRTVFHPDSDYSTFVGSYKPVMVTKKFIASDGKVTKTDVEKITYKFVPQPFMQAYKLAWEEPDTQVYLVIEEINRGNCAQIFGDIFQLLDRRGGYSEYPISANADLQGYLATIKPTTEGKDKIKEIVDRMTAEGIYLEGATASSTPEELFSRFLCLPENLNILATMNTSDQSLFPMDSAFKRRWDMEYVEIQYKGSGKDSESFVFEANGKKYSWIDFLYIVNEKIYDATSSEDKQMGNFFIKDPDLTEEKFKSKVMFYLWDEVCKDLAGSKYNFFYFTDGGKKFNFTYNDLYKAEKKFNGSDKAYSGSEILELFLKEIGVPAPASASAATPAPSPAPAADPSPLPGSGGESEQGESQEQDIPLEG